jgi:excisionase family DNA binding protein
MVFFTVKEVAEVTGLTENTVRKHIRNRKLKAYIDSNGCYLIPEFEVKRYLEDKKKINSGEYFNIDDIGAFQIRKAILYDGSVEVEILLGQHYVKWDNLKKWILSQDQVNSPLTENKLAIIDMEVLNKRGIHFRPSTLVCKACKRYLCTGTICGILHGNDVWIYPIHGVYNLLKMQIEFHEKLTILCIGVLCDNLLSEVGQSINTEFSMKK